MITLVLALQLAAAQQGSQLLVSTDWLAEHINDPRVVVIQAGGRQPDAQAERIPGTRYVAYAAFAPTVNGIANELPSPDSVRSMFAAIGVSDSSQIVLVGQPLSVTRAFYTLDAMGFPRVAVLNGGFAKWKREGRPIETSARPVAAASLSVRQPRADAVASTDWVFDHIKKSGIAFFDTRTEMEYSGIEGANGHIDGARFIDWRQYFTNTSDFELVDRASLEKLWAERARPGDTVVAYCAVGYRASSTYFVSRLLGIPVKLYDGSWDAWAQRKMPSVTAATPLLDGRGIPNTGGELPVVSPDGKYIAYVAVRDGRQADTYVIAVDGKGEKRFTSTAERDERPSWIGSRVYASVRAGDTAATVVLDANGKAGAKARLEGREPRPSSDGKFVVTLAGEPQPKLFVSAPDGSNAKPITDGKTPPPNYAVWSPDGKQIAYATFDFEARNMEVFAMNADGTGATRLTSIPSSEGRIARPAWSPDGRTIAFHARRETGTTPATAHIYLVNVATKELTKLAPHEEPYVDEAPWWFPDGSRIAFQSNRTGRMEIWTMRADGTDPRQVTVRF